MHERIKELYRTATIASDSEEEMVEIFAEMLIRECTNLLPNDSIRNKDGVHMFYVIREHFGVSGIGR